MTKEQEKLIRFISQKQQDRIDRLERAIKNYCIDYEGGILREIGLKYHYEEFKKVLEI